MVKTKKKLIKIDDPKRFLKIKRQTAAYRPVYERIKDYREVTIPRSDAVTQNQAGRCMDCGTPFCHWGCPIGNLIPEWNNALLTGRWKKAFKLLNETNNFPEFTGRVCPALCEASCVLGISDDPVTIRENELSIIEYAFKKNIIKARPPKQRTDKKVAILGSGAAGLACAAQLNTVGHTVTVFEKDDKIGGILRYGIPDFKLEKWVIDRRIDFMKKEGIIFKTNSDPLLHKTLKQLRREFDAIILTAGSRIPRDLDIPGRKGKGIYFAMDYLMQTNRRVMGEKIAKKDIIDAKGKSVIVIGGGDTGSDCIGTANRQGAKNVVQIEIMPQPPQTRTEDLPWPYYPLLLKTTSSHQEGSERQWTVLTKKFILKNGKVNKLECVRVKFEKDIKTKRMKLIEIPNTEFILDADLVFLAIGFLKPEKGEMLKKQGIELDERGNVKTNDLFMSSVDGVFAAGDMRRGQSLIVWAIQEGRCAAHNVDTYLRGHSTLPIL